MSIRFQRYNHDDATDDRPSPTAIPTSRIRIDVSEGRVADLAEYARIPIAFTVRSLLDVTTGDDGEILLSERALDLPYLKDYDALPGEGPGGWGGHFDLSNWGVLMARMEGELVGAAAIAFNTEGVQMLERRRDLALLWDIRVLPELRGHGVGSALFRGAEKWGVARGCRELKIETQNNNVPACRFYAGRGCELRAVNRAAYPELPEEIQMLWYKEIGKEDSGS